MHADRIVVQVADFEVASEYQRLAGDADIGAVVLFVGRVRDLYPAATMTDELSAGQRLAALELEHYPGMTEKALARIASQARERWALDAVTIIHRVGPMAPAEQIVLVLTASAHRAAAYDANRYIMDYLKTEAPFWKKEVTPQQTSWVEAKESDRAAQQHWEK